VPERRRIVRRKGRFVLLNTGFLSLVVRSNHPRHTPYWYFLKAFRTRLRRAMGRYPSGQRGQTVNLLPSASKVRILASPPHGGSLSRLALRLRHWIERSVVTGDETGGRSSVVELQPSKLAVASSNLVARSKPNLSDPKRFECARREKATTASRAHVAQLAEHVLGKDEVTRSIRVVGSKPSSLVPLHSIKLRRIGNTSSSLNWTRPEAPSINMRARIFSFSEFVRRDEPSSALSDGRLRRRSYGEGKV
jgi:hypothetical protein